MPTKCVCVYELAVSVRKYMNIGFSLATFNGIFGFGLSLLSGLRL